MRVLPHCSDRQRRLFSTQQDVMTPCFTALYYAAAAALFSYMADGGPRVEYPPCCLVEVGGIDGGRESIDFVSKDSPHEARRNVALTPQTYDNRPGGTNPACVQR